MSFNWLELSKEGPISILAPMEDVTDTVFRQVLIHIGRPDVFFTEFTNLEGLFSPGAEEVSKRLQFQPFETPLIAQVWGTTPNLYRLGAQKASLLGFDGIDINMGCPHRPVVRVGACSALIKNRPLAKEIFEATREGAKGIQVSIKTRIGFHEIDLDWLKFLLELHPDALTVHLRTVEEMSKVPAHFELMNDIAKLRDSVSPQTFLIANGDIINTNQGEKLCKDSGFNGYMIGRGVFQNPYIFAKREISEIEIKERIDLLKYHLNLFNITWGERKNYDILKKYFKIYISNYEGAAELRGKLMETKSVEHAMKVLEELGL
jgi:tRNA-dihydrouridine synthase